MTTTPKPLFWLIHGADFRRSMDWAKTQPRLRELALAASKRKTP